MCLCVPVKILKKGPDNQAIIELKGIRKTIALDFVPHAQVNQYVLVHAGLAISLLEDDEVEDYLKTWGGE